MKRLFEQSKTKESRSIHAAWSAQFEAAKVFSEIPRCSRSIDTGKMKGAELGLLVMGAYPSLVMLLHDRSGDHWSHAQRCIALLVFISRAYNMSNEKLEEILAAYVEVGTRIKVDTRDGHFVEREK